MKRYEPYAMIPDQNGGWVDYEEVIKLRQQHEQEIKKLKEKIEELKNYIYISRNERS